jgi:predicted small lipoprotein YifL
MRHKLYLSIALLFLLQACGHKGPLTLPVAKAQSTSPSTQPAK